jgi:hypothetical protein
MNKCKCSKCSKRISGQGKTGMCRSCCQLNPNAKYKQKYYCKVCGRKICYETAIYGLGMCYSCSHKGIKLTQKHREKISKKLKGKKKKPFTKQHREKLSKALIGKKPTQETKNKIGKANLGKKHKPESIEKMSGKNSIHYIHGEGNFPYPPKFTKSLKKEIKERDNYKCQCCGMSQEEHFLKYKRDIEVHHIDYCYSNCNKSNLITVCKQCNIDANYERDYYYSFYNYIMENYIYV